jgi:TonB family protein
MVARLIFWLTLLCIFPVTLHAQSTETEINARLMHKPLYLRGCWRDSKLHFDSTGHITHNSSPVSFTLSGFELKTIRLKQNKLILEGRRVGLELADNKQRRVPLNGGDMSHPKDVPLYIDIAASPGGNYGPALDAIFFDNLADLVPSLPFYWKTYANKNLVRADTAIDSPAESAASGTLTPIQQSSLSPDIRAHRIGGGIKPPRLLHSAEPTFNEVSRRLKYSGVVLLNLWVKPDGTVTNLSVVRALGMGLDESALAAVEQYKFAPAMENGKPVLVELNVEVNFRIY